VILGVDDSVAGRAEEFKGKRKIEDFEVKSLLAEISWESLGF
jgi:hypothetical protein